MKKIRVLFVEDNPLDVELLIRYIKNAGFEITYEITESLNNLEELIKNNSFDLAICDFNLSGFSGIDAIHRIKKAEKDIPVILVSGDIPDEEAIDAMLAGAKDYVLKDNLKRLIPAMKREFDALEQRREKKKVEVALISSEQKYRDLVEASRDLVWRIDVEGNFNFINNASHSILGYSPASMIGNSFVPYISPEKAEQTIEIHKNVIAGNIYESFPLEMVTTSREIRHLSATAYPSYDDKGVIIGCSGTASDITHIKAYQSQLEESLAEKEILIKEIHHRVKNNLAVISGLFALQSMDVKDEETLMILQESQSRIKSIAAIHEKLYQNHVFSSIEIKEYLDDLVTDIADTYERKDKDISIEVAGDEFSLNVNQAVPFGILANELIVNAYKYAFVDKSEGKIKISIAVKGEEIIFKVTDNGQGLPVDFDIMKLSSLGMTLIRTLAEQLDSGFDWESKPGKGTEFSIKIIPDSIAKETWVEKKPDKIFPTRPKY